MRRPFWLANPPERMALLISSGSAVATACHVGKRLFSSVNARSALRSEVCCVRTVKTSSSSGANRGKESIGPYSGSSASRNSAMEIGDFVGKGN